MTPSEIVAAVFGKPYRYVRGYAPPSSGVDVYSGQLGHSGYDISAPKGTPVYALAAGTVDDASFHPQGGNTVVIGQGDSAYDYAHLADITVKAGQPVAAGTLIGHVGATGVTTGPHLHFTLKQRGKAVDPTSFLAGLATAQPARATNAGASSAAAGAAAPAPARPDPAHALTAYGLLLGALLLLAAVILAR